MGLRDLSVWDQRYLRDPIGDWLTGSQHQHGGGKEPGRDQHQPGPEEPEALGHVESSEAHGQLSTAPCATPGLTPAPGPSPGLGPATAQCTAGQQVPLEKGHRAEHGLRGWLTWGQEEDPDREPVPTTPCPCVLSAGASQVLLPLSAPSPQDPAPAPHLSPTMTVSPGASVQQ